MADNIRIKNIYYMLSYVYQTLREDGVDNVASEDFDNVHNLFAAILARGVRTQIKRGLHRDYLRREEPLAGLRGQIRVAETIKKQCLPLGRIVCAYDDFTPDSLHNRVLKSVLLLLLRHGNVDPKNKSGIKKLLLYFGDVLEISPRDIRWDALKYHRNNASYRMLLGICRLVVEGLLLTTDSGTHRLAKWLHDGKMHELYERFVLSYYRWHHRNLNPSSACIDWDLSEGEDRGRLPRMETDITLQSGDKRLIIDTKYYGKTMQSNPQGDRRTFISKNLYQIYAYVKNSDKEATGNVAGVLLYAKTDEAVTPDEEHVIGGSRIALKTLDLDRDWNAITGQLEKICGWFATEERT
jgi:5-methylcytosine-specific restriction enzyme subunit McrC